MRRTLAISQVALALVLLVTAGLVLRSLERLFAIDPGFDASQLLTLQVQQTGHQLDSDECSYPVPDPDPGSSAPSRRCYFRSDHQPIAVERRFRRLRGAVRIAYRHCRAALSDIP